MEANDAIDVSRHAIYTALLLGSPVLLVGMAVGLLVGLFQALTQVQDQTVAFVPKMAAMVAALAFCLPWLFQLMIEFSRTMIGEASQMIGG